MGDYMKKTPTENQKKLLKILNEIFQLDQSDLDFGIYRIMNTKSSEINEFLDKDLISSVASAFALNDNNSIQKELDEALQQAQSLGADPETLPKVITLREQLSTTSTSSNLENEVFSHLANFFKRYYKDGDFVSLRRYKKDTYAIPYEGEEVKLHWANSDQYYIKSGEYFRDYTFTVNDKTIHLKLSDAQTESNNNKATSDKERRFIYIGSEALASPNELNINFEYKSVGKINQDKLNEEAITKALEGISDIEFITALNTLAPTEKNKKRTIFEKHLKSYTSRNSFDYFIHKDLGGFLGRELDFYIKNEMLFLDDILLCPIKYEEVMGKIKIFKEVSQKVIDFLTQLEELQKKLWEKKKFVIETNYCITLDKIDEEYYEEIFNNKAQLEEWENLFGSEALASQKGGAKAPLPDDLKYLVLDTKFFDMKFKYKLLSGFDNLDEDIDGVLINSENFGALNLLQSRYKEQVKTVYIDPPYNTGNDGFLYNDSYQHSSWMSFMYDRLALGRELMNNEGVIFSSIDDAEQNNLGFLLRIFFNKFISNITIHRKRGSDNSAESVSKTHDFLQVFGKTKTSVLGRLPLDENTKKAYKNPLNDSRGIYRSLGLWARGTQGGVEYEYTTNDGYTFSKRLWLVAEKTMKTLDADDRLIRIDDKLYRKFFITENKGSIAQTIWTDVSNNANAADTLKGLFKRISFSTPKPLELIERILRLTKTPIILDYFAGSGTTGHAVINLNREDKGNRKYILVEMGEYFDTVTKPRIQKVIYSDSWKDGKPTTKDGISQIFKYFKLESYEDTLNNLEFKKTQEQQATLDMYPQAKEDYILNYSLDVESQGSLLNIDNFKSPFNYTLKIATSSVGETKDTNIDLVETFNYLLGLVVKRIELLYPKGISSQAHSKGYLVVEGQNLKKEKILIIWRDGQSSDELNEFFKKMDWSVYDREFDTIYVNGDNNLDNLRKDEDHFKVKLTEQEFKKLMFGE
jgi:adenine-specific DNA-methyltransferase